MAISYTALATPAEVKARMMGAMETMLSDEVAASSGDLYDGLVDIIEDATLTVEGFLNRDLIIRAQTLRLCAADWKTREGFENDDDDLLIVAWARQWPVIEVTAVDDDASLAVDLDPLSRSGSSDVEAVGYDPESTLITEKPFRVDAFCGYRRSDQGIGTPGSGDAWTVDLLLETGLSALTASIDDIPLLPRDIRRVAINIAEYDLRTAMQGLIGLDSAVKQVDRMTVDLRKPREAFVEEQLASINHHRWIPA